MKKLRKSEWTELGWDEDCQWLERLESFDWKACPGSERFINKDNCNDCNGTGKLCTSSSQKCEECKSTGWVDSDDGELLCPTCKGMRSVAQEKSDPCKSCDAKGYTIQILQSFEAVTECYECEITEEYNPDMIACRACKGTGNINAQIIRTCPECEGQKGWTAWKQYSHEEWQESEFAKVSLEEVPFDNELDVTFPNGGYCYELKEGILAVFTKCECLDSQNLPDNHCPACKGKGTAIWIYDGWLCSTCQGEGGISEIETLAKCSSCKGTGRNECWMCHDEGFITVIMDRKV